MEKSGINTKKPVKVLQTLGVASCLGGSHDTCHNAPYVLRDSSYNHELLEHQLALQWHPVITLGDHLPNSLDGLQEISQEIADYTYLHTIENLAAQHLASPFLVVSGEHSSAIGTWSGVLQALAKHNKTLGLIWFDAHLDAHTLQTSPSGNLHGMPLSVLLGKADEKLQSTQPILDKADSSPVYLQGDLLSLIGVRSYENEELDLLNEANVSLYGMSTIKQNQQLEKLLNHVAYALLMKCDYIGISLDLDAISPDDAPAVETAEPHGISGSLLNTMFKQFNFHDKLIGLEITEFNPVNDIHGRTERLIMQLLISLFTKR